MVIASAMTPLLGLAIATAIVLVIRWPMRRVGLWLQRRGTEMERDADHG
jgi:hypothetical protein